MPAPAAHRGPSIRKARIPASSSLKARVMESLEQEESATTRALSTRLALHQSSVSHTLKELMEEDLVTKKGKGYRLSNVGIIQRNIHNLMIKSLRCLEDHKDFFLSHDLSGIPQGFQVSMGVVDEGRMIIEKDPAMPFQVNDIIIPLLAQSRNFLVASSTMVPDHQQTVARAMREGGHLKTVTTARVIQELRLKNHILKDDSLHSRMELYCHKNINLHLIIADSHLFLALPRLDGTYDLENVIISREEAAVEWGRMLFYYFLSGSEKVDLATF